MFIMIDFSEHKLDRIRDQILNNRGHNDICLSKGKRYVRYRPNDIEVLERLLSICDANNKVMFADIYLKLLFEAGQKDETIIVRRLSSLTRLGKFNEGIKFCREVEPLLTTPTSRATLQHAAASLGEFPLALRVAKTEMPAQNDALSWSFLASSYQNVGDLDKAEQYYKKARDIDDNISAIHFFISSLHKHTRSNNNIARLIPKAQDAKLGSEDYKRYAYALGKEHEDIKNYDDAFNWYAKGAASARSGLNYHINAEKRLCLFLAELYEMPGTQGVSTQKRTPLFILGMPRTGSTLLERMLSLHSQIVSRGETWGLSSAIKQQFGNPMMNSQEFERKLLSTTFVDYRQLGGKYLDYVQPKEECVYFVEKMPHNIFFAGIILRAFPDARIIYTSRNPMDTCFSNFKQYFNGDHFPYSYNLLETAEHYLLVKDYALHWLRVCPDRIMASNYDAFINEPEKAIRKTLKFLNLPFEQDCLSPEKNTDGLTSASFSQARQPIYKSSVRKWRHYEKHLEPLVSYFRAKKIALE